MGLKAVPGRSRPRVGLVLGAGGSWRPAVPPCRARCTPTRRTVDVIVGTSAGGSSWPPRCAGISIDELIAHQRGEAVGPLDASAVDHLTGGPWPPAPHLRLGSARLMLALLLSPHRVHPGVLASAWMPLTGEPPPAPRDGARPALPRPRRPAIARRTAGLGRPRHLDRGRRLPLRPAGRLPQARCSARRLPEAVVASCSICDWVPARGDRRPPLRRRRCPLDDLARRGGRAGLDEVFVLAPMASVVADRPRMPHEVLGNCGR